ncbi:tetratricopeptide repeat protein [Patescibacteria group bacterium]|nr:MAG: tetratricopeptide repeat protein [Patescibacteria group bacterium]
MDNAINLNSSNESLLEKIGSWAVAGIAFLMPVFFIPSAVFPFQFSKVLVVLVGVVLILTVFSIRVLRKGNISFLWSKLLIPLLALPIAYFISSVFSPVPSVSLFGFQLDQDTFGFIALMSILAFATTLVVRTEKRIFSTLFALMIAGWGVLLFQIIQIVFKNPILPSLFSSPIANTVGSWNDLSLFIGLIAALSIFALETLNLAKLSKVLLGITLAVSLFFLAVANFQLAWILVSLVAFVMLIAAFTRKRPVAAEDGSAPSFGTKGILSIVVFAIAVFFLFFGGTVQNPGPSTVLQDNFNIQALDVRPSVVGTLTVLQSTYTKSPVFGSGPNTFSSEWLASRPAEIVATPFWNVAFTSGFGSIPTSFATGGVLVAFAWLLLIGFLLFTTVRALLTAPMRTDRSYLLIAATSLGSLFLLVAHVFYVPSQGLTALLFLFIGLFIASLRSTDLARPVSISFTDSPRLGFLSVLLVAVSLVVSLVSLYGTGAVYAAGIQEGKAVLSANSGDLDGAIVAVTKAAQLSPQDRYFRMLTAIYVAKMNEVAQTGTPDKKTQDEFQAYLAAGVDASQRAVSANSLNADNWLSRASVYETVVPLKITGAYENAIETLKEAEKRNPRTPEVDYRIASLEAFSGKFEDARKSAESAVQKKADYTPAILLLAQLALNEGRINDAIDSVNSAIVFNPNNSQLLYQLGLLQLEAKKYAEAGDSFESALLITPDYANASYFLGQTKVLLNQPDEALLIFKSLQEKNGDNATLKAVIEALEKGENPFSEGTVAPQESTTGI